MAISRRDQLRRWLAQRELRRLWKGALAAIVAVAALFGGLDTVNTGATPFQQGEAFDDGQYSVVVNGASVLREVQGGGRTIGPAKPGKRYLGVVVTLGNEGTVPGRLRNEIDLRDVPGKELLGVWRYRNGSSIQNLGPGLTEKLVYLWIIPEGAVTPGDTITLRVWKKSYRQLLVAYGGKEWLDSVTDYGVVDVVVKKGSS
jgi:hypothetical protein